MSKYKMQSILAGHSGCKIYLMEDENKRPFVRKFSKDINYNERLKLQCEKQKNFHSLILKAPKVLACGINEEGLFYFDMEYIHGITLAEYIKKIHVSEIQEIVNILTSQIELFNYKVYEDNSKIFDDKIKNLYKSINIDGGMSKFMVYHNDYGWQDNCKEINQ